MSFESVVRPVIDRVHVSVIFAARPALRAAYGEWGLKRPNMEADLYPGLLARPMSAAAVTAALIYQERDRAVEAGTARQDQDGAWHLTDLGRTLAEANQRLIGEAAARVWSRRPIPTMTGLDGVDRLNDLVGRLLVAGRATGGLVFGEMTPVYEPADATPAARLVTRVTALRHHRSNAHRTAWEAAGLSVDGIRALPSGPEREAIEAETNRLDAPIYGVLDADERLELLGGLGALADGLTG